MMNLKPSKLLENLPKQFFASLVMKVNESIKNGHDVINLGQGNPDQPTPKHIIKALQNSVENPITHKYSPFRGISSLKQAIVDFYKREYDVDLDPEEEVAILFGGKAGLVELPLCLCDEGDTILVPDPGYPDYLSGIALSKTVPYTLPLIEENHFLPDYQKIPQEVLDASKILFINYPNNPTGAVATSEFFEETVQLAKNNQITVCHDFAYGAFGFDGKKPISFLQTPGSKDCGIEIYTLSKTYNMAGWRVGFAVGNKEVVSAINLLQDHLYVSLFPAIQEAAAAALTESQDSVKELLSLYEERRNIFIKGCREIGWNVTAPAGSFFAWLKVPNGFTSSEFADLLLEKAHIAVAPGNGFGEFGEGYVRVGLLTDTSRLEEAISRLKNLEIFLNI
ncbi:pyridoxal phosphate-dependent aminotransferase [Gottfriedia solisilvae]|uniref:pyridoxal phosphate-dependent aminotransferase n=1 Tax=Gottfriedia solisilvae TaxID=1516104 RepID=UPI000B43ABAC|nr:pyridoxal phosphate-dependent aminotransferase [Gottfriedia solisilvae]